MGNDPADWTRSKFIHLTIGQETGKRMFRPRRIIRRLILKMLIYLRLYPHIFLIIMPFKRYEFEELLRGIKFSRDDLILDIGCGGGVQTLLLGKRCRKVYGIDISEEAINVAKSRSRYVEGRINSEFRCVAIENAGFENDYFDKVFSICVIEHIPNYMGVLREAYRVLKKDGQMIFSVDSLEAIRDNELLHKHKEEHAVERYFKKEELITILEEIGYNRISIYPIFRSDFAKKLFIQGINNRFRYGSLQSILDYFLLRYAEKHCVDQEKGIFLIAKCYK